MAMAAERIEEGFPAKSSGAQRTRFGSASRPEIVSTRFPAKEEPRDAALRMTAWSLTFAPIASRAIHLLYRGGQLSLVAGNSNRPYQENNFMRLRRIGPARRDSPLRWQLVAVLIE
jgi:hypothetical protein